LNAQAVPFVQHAQPAPGADAVVDSRARTLRRARALARVAKVELDLVAIGNNDDSRVRAQRAQWLALELCERGIVDARVADASKPPLGDGVPEQRSASLHATVQEVGP
jgi:hypothetical protein